ncbi:MAG: hypothetical protein AAB870_01020 [Patescibacteria group bacterium]
MDINITIAFNKDCELKQEQGTDEKIKAIIQALCELHNAVEHTSGIEYSDSVTVLSSSAWHEWFNRKVFSFTLQSPTHIKSGVIVLEESHDPLVIYLLEHNISRQWGDFFGSYCTIASEYRTTLKYISVYTRREHADTHQNDDVLQSWGSGEVLLHPQKLNSMYDELHTLRGFSFTVRYLTNRPYTAIDV